MKLPTKLLADVAKRIHRQPVVAALILFAAEAHGTTVFQDQTESCVAGVPSVQSLAVPGFDSQAADDIVVPAGQSWGVTQIYAPGVYLEGFAGVAQSVNIQFFADDAGKPGNAVDGCTDSGITTFSDSMGTLTISLPSACVLQGGISGATFWISVQPVTGTGADFGVWYWTENTVQNGYLAQWQNPPLGWHEGCATWGARNACNLDGNPDQCFSISGQLDVIFSDGFGDL